MLIQKIRSFALERVIQPQLKAPGMHCIEITSIEWVVVLGVQIESTIERDALY